MYESLNINQKITLKELIINKKYRTSILGPKVDHKSFQIYSIFALISNWKESINLFLEPK